MGNVVQSLTGGLLGGKKQSSATREVIRPVESKNNKVDPNRSESIAQARRRKRAVQNRSNAVTLRTDLSSGSSITRSGISIGGS